MFGYSGETKETMLKTLECAFESGLHSPRFYILQLFPGTEIYEAAQRQGFLKNFDLAALKVFAGEPQIETDDFSRQDVRKIYDLAYDILKKRNYDEVKDKLENILNW